MNFAWLILVSLSLLHLYWAVGGLWPGKDRRELAAKIIGDRPMPGSIPCLVVAVALLIGPWRYPQLAACVFLLRGTLGLVEARFRPSIIGTPYQQLSRWIYSPLSLWLGWALWP